MPRVTRSFSPSPRAGRAAACLDSFPSVNTATTGGRRGGGGEGEDGGGANVYPGDAPGVKIGRGAKGRGELQLGKDAKDGSGERGGGGLALLVPPQQLRTRLIAN